MKQLYNYWLPDDESHFSKFIKRNADAGLPAEYQEPVRTKALSHVSKFDVSIDIGANFGLWSYTLEKQFTKNFAIEPIQEHCDFLTLNAPNTTIFQTALGTTTGTIQMQRNFENYGKTRIDNQGNTSVSITLLDSLNLPPADFIKIDVEGFELEVLQGGKQYIQSSYPLIVMEQEDKKSTAGALLRSWGYHVIDSVKHDYIYKKL
jgi:FkbM family methyltransferase